jgi:DNA-binding transcriptional ArsR family regulator
MTSSNIVPLPDAGADPDEAQLDRVFFALSDPVRRAILQRLGEEALLVSEIAAPFNISMQAVSRHIQVLVRAGLVQQQRTGRISRCSLVAGPIYAVAVWINRYSKYWQEQFDMLAVMLEETAAPRRKPRTPRWRAKRAASAATLQVRAPGTPLKQARRRAPVRRASRAKSLGKRRPR